MTAVAGPEATQTERMNTIRARPERRTAAPEVAMIRAALTATVENVGYLDLTEGAPAVAAAGMETPFEAAP
jgi:hypothetical protein